MWPGEENHDGIRQTENDAVWIHVRGVSQPQRRGVSGETSERDKVGRPGNSDRFRLGVCRREANSAEVDRAVKSETNTEQTSIAGEADTGSC